MKTIKQLTEARDYDNRDRAQLNIEGERISIGMTLNTSFNSTDSFLTDLVKRLWNVSDGYPEEYDDEIEAIVRKHCGGAKSNFRFPEYERGKSYGDDQSPMGSKYKEIEDTIADATRAFEAMMQAYIKTESEIIRKKSEAAMSKIEAEIKKKFGEPKATKE